MIDATHTLCNEKEANLRKHQNVSIVKYKILLLLFAILILTQSCENSNDKMVKILAARYKMYNVKKNSFASEAEVAYYDSIIKSSDEGFFKLSNELSKAMHY